jgi:ABC-type transport system involved in multi-copper enzyme maturation permease subunit
MKSLTIAFATAKEAIRQPAFFVMAAFAGGLLLVTIWVSYFTFGEDIKMYKDTGLTTISFFCMLLALLTASSTVADEIEGKTAITLLSKPINRRQFILGKFLGIELGVLTLYVLLGVLFAAGVYYKYAYDLREAAGGIAESAKQWEQVRQILPGLVLGFFEVTVLTSISVAISTRLPMLANLVVCILIFFLGHLSPVLVEAATAPDSQINELVGFMARLFAWALPSLEFFNAGPSISTGAVIPWVGYVLPAFGYCVLYSGAALLFAFLLFEDRDLA